MKRSSRFLSLDDFEDEVRKVVKGATTPKEAEGRLKDHFLNRPDYVVIERNGWFQVSGQQFAGGDKFSVICER